MFLSELLDEYLAVNTSVRSAETVRLMRLSVQHFGTYLGRAAEVSDLTDRLLAGYVQHRRAMGRAETTIERELAKLYTLARFACLEGHIPPLRLKPFKANVDPPIGFSASELRRLFAAAHRYDVPVAEVAGHIYMRALVYTFWDTLERSGAVWAIERKDLDVDGVWWRPRRGWVTLRERKGGGRVLRRQLRTSTTRYVRALLKAHSHREAFAIGKHRTALYYHWGRLLKQAGIPDDRWHGPHCIRKTGGSNYQKLGGRAQDVLDHSDEATTRKYYLVPSICGEAQPIDKLRDPFGLFRRLLSAFGL